MKQMFLMGLLAILAGCTIMTPRSPDEPHAAKVVTMDFHNFDPPSVTVSAGQVVEWDNSSLIWHTVTCDPKLAKRPGDVALPQGASNFDSGQVEPGHRFYHLFTTSGTYRYFCQPHELNGMIGEVIVTP